MNQKQLMTREWERICFMQREITKIQHWMISTFPSTSGRWVHQESGVTIDNAGDGLLVSKCSTITDYRIVFSKKIGNACYLNFPVTRPYSNETFFLRTADKHLVALSPTIKCKDRPKQTYLKDKYGIFHLITADGHISKVRPKTDTDHESNGIHLKLIRGYDSRLLHKSPPKLEPYAMLDIFTYVHDAVQEVKELQAQYGDGNVLLGIGRALGSTIQGVAQGGSSIIRAFGGAIHDVLSGAGDLDEKIVGSLGDAASKVISSTGGAIKDTTSGIGNLFHGVFGGIGGTIKWGLVLIIVAVLIYMNKDKLKQLMTRKKNIKEQPNQPSLADNNKLTTQTEHNVSISTEYDNETSMSQTKNVVASITAVTGTAIKQSRTGVEVVVLLSSGDKKVNVKAVLDTGSPVTIISEKMRKLLNSTLNTTTISSEAHFRPRT